MLGAVRYRYLQLAVIPGALSTLAYSGGAELAAAQVHGKPVSVGVNIAMTGMVVFGVLCVFATFTALLANFGGMFTAGVLVVIFAGAVVTGDIWGVAWFATGLPRDLAAHRHWYMILYPGSAAFLSWWITLSIAIGILTASVHKVRPPPACQMRNRAH